MDVEGFGRLSVHDGLLNFAWFCVCKLVSSLAEDECKFCGGGRCKWDGVGRQNGLCGSCLIRVTNMHNIKSIRIFEDDVRRTCSCDSRRFTLGVWVGGVMYVI